MLSDPVVEVLVCPVCGAGLASVGRALRCEAGHSFDIARQGYVNLRGSGRPTGAGDTADMVAARSDFLGHGHYAPIAHAVSGLVSDATTSEPRTGEPETSDRRPGEPGEWGRSAAKIVVDVGGGTGYYLAHSLDQLPEAYGIAMDVSSYALRRAAKAHPRATAVGADVWHGLPLRDGCAAVLVDVFAPRNAAEFQRVLRPGGALVVVTPTAAHLAELVHQLDMLSVDARKDERVEETLAGRFTLDSRAELTYPLNLTADNVSRLVQMGPSARHVDARKLTERLRAITAPVTVTASVVVARYRSK